VTSTIRPFIRTVKYGNLGRIGLVPTAHDIDIAMIVAAAVVITVIVVLRLLGLITETTASVTTIISIIVPRNDSPGAVTFVRHSPILFGHLAATVREKRGKV